MKESLIIAFLMILLMAGCTKVNTKENEMNVSSTNNTIFVSPATISYFEDDIYINNIPLPHGSRSIIIYNEKYYISLQTLQNYISNEFVRCEDNIWYFRKNIYYGTITKLNEKIFFPLDEIELYIRKNKNLENNEVLYLTTALPANIIFEDNSYLNAENFYTEKRRTPNPPGEYSGLTEDGREIWENGEYLWIFDDSGYYVQFTLPPYTINVK